MAYVTGSAADIDALLAALRTACTDNGYTLTGSVLSKGTLHASLSKFSSTALRLVGCTGHSSGTPSGTGPQWAAVGGADAKFTAPLALVFPVTYHVHIGTAPDEVYMMLNHSTDYWQWLAFGQSPADGCPGTGNWYGGSRTEGQAIAGNTVHIYEHQAAGSGAGGNTTSGALFAQTLGYASATGCTSYFHAGLNPLLNGWSHPGCLGRTEEHVVDAWEYQRPLLGRSPSTWNGQAVLLPITVVSRRPSTKFSVVGSLGHARYLRNDNLADGEIITLGTDEYRVYPWVKKNAAVRIAGYDVQHSGTFGVAIRYDGP